MTTTYNDPRDDRTVPPEDENFQDQSEHVSRRLSESAQNIWLAGLGAFGRVQSEGSKLFDSLVREGATVERKGRRRAHETAEEVRDEVETQFDQARSNAVRGWDRLGKVFDERVQGVLRSLKIPDREEVESLRQEVESLKAQARANAAATQRAAEAASQAQATAASTSAAAQDSGVPNTTFTSPDPD